MLDKIPFINKLTDRLPGAKSGSSDPDTAAMYTTPWRYRDTDAVYVGWANDVWMYRELKLDPMLWEDPKTRLSMSSPLASLLSDLGATSQDLGGGLASMSRNREIHLVSLTYETEATPPEGTPQALKDYLDATLDFLVPTRVLLIGVKLRSSLSGAITSRSPGKSTLDAIKAQLTQTLSEDVPDLAGYSQDRTLVRTILESNGAGRIPSREVLNQLEAWYNLGRTTDVTIMEAKDCLYIGDTDRIEIAAVTEFEQAEFKSPYATWLLDAMTHPEGASVVSVRAELQPANVAKGRVRRGQRKILAQMEEESATGDLERPEHSATYQSLQGAEEFLGNSREAILTNTSFLLARRVTHDVVETYMDELNDVYGIHLKPLEHRQLFALDETLPCSIRRVNPFLQDVTIPVLSHAGLQGFSNLGDPTGVFVGLVDPDYVPCYLNPLGAPAANMPPGMLVAGDPGSGKAQPLTAKILTPSGWKLMGDIKVGSQVIGQDGQPHKVSGVFPQGMRPIFEFLFSDGSSTQCDQDHLWGVYDDQDNYSVQKASTLVESLNQESPPAWKVPLVQPVLYKEAFDDEDLYTLALRLVSGSPHPKTPVLAIAGHPPGEGRLLDQSRSTHFERDIETFKQALTGSLAQRLDLLWGITDTTGQMTSNKQLMLTVPRDLSALITALVNSLGGTTEFVEHNVSGGALSTCMLEICLPPSVTPFKRSHQASTYTKTKAPQRVLQSARFVGFQPAQCIMVDSKDHLYITDDYIVTHNTFMCQMIALQSAIAGLTTIFINPKGFDTLAPFAALVDGAVVSMSSLEKSSGAFDPFRYADPEQAAEIATSHILAVLGNVGVAGMGLDTTQEIKLSAGLRRGAIAGARCVNDALNYVDDEGVKLLVRELAGSNSTFALGIGQTPGGSFESSEKLTLIEFDRPLDLPEKGVPPSNYSQAQKVSVAAMRLVTRASLHILANSNGGVLIVDEAWTFLSNEEGRSVLQSMGRLGRSQNILPIFATQRVDDLVREGVDMEGYLSRVFVMKLSDEREATAALKLCGLEATPQRIQWLRDAAPRREEEGIPARPALALHRDLKNRHSAMMIGPVPEAAQAAFTTNPEDRARIREERERERQAAIAASNQENT